MVRRPELARIICARSTASRMSLTPDSTADNAMNSAWKASAISRASVVLPTPGGPHRIIECACARFERDAQRLAGTEQMLLADHVVQRFGPQALG